LPMEITKNVPSEYDILYGELAARELARRNYASYLAYVHPDWIPTRMSTFLANKVQEFIETPTGNAYDILVIEAPPQHGKSMTISESLPSWYLGKYPTARIIEASYNEETAERFARRNKEKIKQFGAILFSQEIGEIDRATEFELTNHRGRMISRGIMSGITGNPANLLLIDDPIKNRMEADSETLRNRIWDEWQNTLKARLSAGAKVVLIMTPWHEDDLAARILNTEHNVTLLRLPVEAEQDDPLGREPGEPLCPELGKDAAWLADFKPAYIRDPEGGARAWSALYMCSPRVEEGDIIKRNWWQYYNPNDIPAFGTEVISVDATFKGGKNNDFVAITVWGKRGLNYYCRYCLNQHLDFPGTLQAIRSVRALFPRATAVLIEDKANGSAIISVLQREMFCIPVNPRGGKEARVNAIAPAIESGHVFLPVGAPWVSEMVDQFAAFPAAAHDDICDSVSQALSYMLFSSGAYEAPVITEEERYFKTAEEKFLDGDVLFDPYSAMDPNTITGSMTKIGGV